MIVVGIDPGKTGYICELDSELRTARTMALPFRADEIICRRAIDANFSLEKADILILEKVSVQPLWSTASGMTFGKIVGQLQMILSQWAFLEVSSRTWQKTAHLGFAVHMRPKEKSLAAFHRINPTYYYKKLDHNMIDAFLIAEYGLRISGINTKGGWHFDHIKP